MADSPVCSMEKEITRSYAFDLEFQKYLLASFLTDEKVLRDHLEIFQPEFFGDDTLQGVALAVKDFFNKHGDTPTEQVLLQEIKEYVAPGTKLTDYESVIGEIYERVGVNASYYQEKAVEFAKIHILHNALRESYSLVEQGDTKEVGATLMKALKECEDADKNGFYDYFKGVADRALGYFNHTHKKEERKRIPTGFPPLDDRIQGGLGLGETGVIVAPAKHGKTTTLISMAVQALVREKKVLYITLELRKEVIAGKFDSNMTGSSLENLRKKPKSFQDRMEKLMEKIKGGLTIVEFPTKTLTLTKLHSTIDKVKPNIVFVDYAQIMRSGRDGQERRHEISELHEGLRRVAGECNVPIWTAHQSNRMGFGAKTVQMENIAEDISVASTCDVLVSVNQNPEEKRRGTLRFAIIGNRLGSSGETISCSVDWSLSRIVPAFGESEEELS